MVETNNFERARFNMVEQQVRPWEVLDQQVLDQMLSVPREEFVPPAYRAIAFTDVEIPMGHGESMLPPKVVGRLVQALAAQPGDIALEVGSGTGYATALLARLCRFVYSVEIEPELAEAARRNLARIGVENVRVEAGDGAQGWSARDTYDLILVTGSLPQLPDALLRRLSIGGRLVVVLGEEPVMEACLYTRLGAEQWGRVGLFDTVIPPLRNVTRPSTFKL